LRKQSKQHIFVPSKEQNNVHTKTLASMTHNKNNNRAAALSLAWAIRKETTQSWGAAQRQAWAVIRLRNAMAAAAVQFSFVKENGEVRKANGTLCANLFTYESKGTGAAAKPCVVRYWDLDANGYRSFNAGRLIAA
jgi:hypothetical protein